jgi:hypothetical protein
MAQRYSLVFSSLAGVGAALLLLLVVAVVAPPYNSALPAKPTYVDLPTPSPTPLPIITPTPTPGPQGDLPASIAPFGDG